MRKNFFDLSSEMQKSILRSAENKLKVPANMIEKDIWVCWLLKQLSTLPVKITFKGGTSLSKVFNLIKRFSEDIDLTIDYRNFLGKLDIATTSKSQLKKISDDLKVKLKYYNENTILPFLQQRLQSEFSHTDFQMILSKDGEKLEFYYPPINSQSNYLRDHVLLEFGGRNSTEPSQPYKITTLLSQLTDDSLELPTANIETLSPVRTFWEKATLIHVEYHRSRFSENPDRLSRHWYDLAMLANSPIGKEALHQREILADVILHKSAFFNASYAHYKDCLTGSFKLVPEETQQESLFTDFKKMQEAGMFQEEPPSFEEIINTLAQLERRINLEQ